MSSQAAETMNQPATLLQPPSSSKTRSGLVLFFTLGVTLTDWEHSGYLQREVAYYKQLEEHVGPITFVTYGGEADLALEDRLDGIRVIANTDGLRPESFLHKAPQIHRDALAGAAVYKSNQIKGAQAVLDAAALTGGASVVRCGYLLSRFKNNSPISMRMKFGLWRREMAMFHQADRVLLPTSEDAVYARRWYALPTPKVKVISNFVDTKMFAPSDEVPCEPGLVGFVGRLAPQKNLTALIEAMAGLKGATLRLIGEGSQEKELADLAKARGVTVEFWGAVPHLEIPRLLAECEIFVLPSLYEGLPKALLEAMSAAVPVIATKVQGSEEVIKHRQTGWLCEDTSAESLRKALITLLEDSRLRAQIGRDARRYVQENFSIERVLGQEVAVYREMGVV
jgi:glycosyltransferase involved in cell wall biosynthesis